MKSRLNIVTLALGLLALAACEMGSDVYPVHWPEPARAELDSCPALSGVFGDHPTRSDHAQDQLLTEISLARLLLDNLTTESEYHNYDSYRPYLFIDAQKGELIFSEKSVNTHHDLSKLLSTGGRKCRNGTLYIEPELGKDKFQAGLGFGYNKADIELSRDIENNIVSKVIVSSYALIGLIMPVYIEENYWMMWTNISQSERMCELPDGTVEKRAAESCLSSDGYIVN